MEPVIHEASALAPLIFPDEVPEWPDWLFWRDIYSQYSEVQLFRMGPVQAMCRIEGALYMVRHQAPRTIRMEEYRPRIKGSFPLFKTDHIKRIWRRRILNRWTHVPKKDLEVPPPEFILNQLPGLVMQEALSDEVPWEDPF